jgi:hypothetical protein
VDLLEDLVDVGRVGFLAGLGALLLGLAVSWETRPNAKPQTQRDKPGAALVFLAPVVFLAAVFEPVVLDAGALPAVDAGSVRVASDAWQEQGHSDSLGAIARYWWCGSGLEGEVSGERTRARARRFILRKAPASPRF